MCYGSCQQGVALFFLSRMNVPLNILCRQCSELTWENRISLNCQGLADGRQFLQVPYSSVFSARPSVAVSFHVTNLLTGSAPCRIENVPSDPGTFL